MEIEDAVQPEPKDVPHSLHVAWAAFQRRQVSMAPDVGFECVFLPIKAKGKVAKALAYVMKLFSTLALLRKATPCTVWIQLPQVPLLWAALLYRALMDKHVRVVADCHNAMFRPPWSRFPLGLSLLGRCDCVVVHNDVVKEQAIGLGISAARLVVLEDVPPHVDIGRSVPEPDCMQGYARPWVLFPGSFAADEPIKEVIETARLLPDIVFVITGKLSNSEKFGHDVSNLPSNVLLPDFLPLDQFDRLLMHADVVMGLTRAEGIQLSVCNEALGYGKPLIISNTELLSRMFSAGGQLVDSSDPQSISDGVQHVLDNLDHYREASRTQAMVRRREWRKTQLAGYMRMLHRSG